MSKEQPKKSKQGIKIDNAELTGSPIGQAENDVVQGDNNFI